VKNTIWNNVNWMVHMFTNFLQYHCTKQFSLTTTSTIHRVNYIVAQSE